MKRPIVNMKIATRFPEKYRLVDLETGDVWEIIDSKWKQSRTGKRSFDFSTFTLEEKAMSREQC